MDFITKCHIKSFLFFVLGFHSASSNSRSISEGTYSFIHLKPDTEYEVKIRAKNYYGWSEDEPAVVFKTSNKGSM